MDYDAWVRCPERETRSCSTNSAALIPRRRPATQPIEPVDPGQLTFYLAKNEITQTASFGRRPLTNAIMQRLRYILDLETAHIMLFPRIV